MTSLLTELAFFGEVGVGLMKSPFLWRFNQISVLVSSSLRSILHPTAFRWSAVFCRFHSERLRGTPGHHPRPLLRISAALRSGLAHQGQCRTTSYELGW